MDVSGLALLSGAAALMVWLFGPRRGGSAPPSSSMAHSQPEERHVHDQT